MSIQFAPKEGIAARAIAARDGNPSMVRYEAACRALAEAKAVDEVKEIRNQAEAMRAYAKQAENKQLETDAAEIRIRATRRIGELMSLQRDAGAGLMNRGGGDQKTDHRVENKPGEITLSEAGIDKNLANEARKLAAIPETEFDGTLLPCPFCGGKAWERGTPSGLSRIECDGCQIGQFESCSFNEAQKRWNRRAALSQDTHSLPSEDR